MRRPTLSAVFVLAAALTAGGCSKSNSTTPVTPSPTSTTEAFSGTLQVNGAITFPFVVTTAGSANATLTELDPDLTLTLQPGGTGDFTVGETVYQGATVDTSTGSAIVYRWDAGTRRLYLRSITGSFTTATLTVGVDGGAAWTVDAVDYPVIGIALGTWSGTTCSIVLANDIAAVGSVVTGAVQGQGSLCARVYDVGQISTAATFSLNVTHF
jgi:hypothetical protein